MRFVLWSLLVILLATPLYAQKSPDFPGNTRVVIQLTSSQFVSGLGDYLVPPLYAALQEIGLIYDDGSNADYAATVEIGSDVGKWRGSDNAEWLYERYVTVGLSPAEKDIELDGKLQPSFSVTVLLVTPDPDRVDELNCLIDLATRELAARYRPKGHVFVDGKRCARD